MAPADTQTYDPNTLLKKAQEVARYYGFTYLPDFLYEHKQKRNKMESPSSCTPKDLAYPNDIFSRMTHSLAELSELSPRHPLLVWGSSITPGRSVGKKGDIYFAIYGAESSLTDAFLLRTASAFGGDVGGTCTLGITSLGDPETRERHQKDIAQYIRKYINAFSPELQARLRADAKSSLQTLLEYGEGMPATPPSTLEHLSEPARIRFEELLEHLDESDTPYELAPHLTDPSDFFSHTRFRITSEKGFVGEGGRFGSLVKKFDKRGKNAIGVSFSFKTDVCESCKTPVKPRAKPIAVFIQLGGMAKRSSFSLLDDIRVTKVPIMQTITIESLGDQIEAAERYNAPYHLIMGHKEVLEGTVILRDMRNHAQEIIPRNLLVERIRTLS